MKTSLLIICGIGFGWVGTWLLHDIFLIVWKQGYDAGRKAEVESWAKCMGDRTDAETPVDPRLAEQEIAF